jgi:hypothetical protein
MVRTVKTKKELEEDLSKAMSDARARYDSIVKPAQEKFKAVEQNARIKLEEDTKPLWDTFPKEVYNNPKPYISGGEQLYEGKAFPGAPDNYSEIEQYLKAINGIEKIYDITVETAMSDYKRIEKPAKQQLYVAERLARQQYDKSVKELRKVDDWFEFRRTYQKSLKTEKTEEIKETEVDNFWERQKKKCGNMKKKIIQLWREKNVR